MNLEKKIKAINLTKGCLTETRKEMKREITLSLFLILCI